MVADSIEEQAERMKKLAHQPLVEAAKTVKNGTVKTVETAKTVVVKTRKAELVDI